MALEPREPTALPRSLSPPLSVSGTCFVLFFLPLTGEIFRQNALLCNLPLFSLIGRNTEGSQPHWRWNTLLLGIIALNLRCKMFLFKRKQCGLVFQTFFFSDTLLKPKRVLAPRGVDMADSIKTLRNCSLSQLLFTLTSLYTGGFERQWQFKKKWHKKLEKENDWQHKSYLLGNNTVKWPWDLFLDSVLILNKSNNCWMTVKSKKHFKSQCFFTYFVALSFS